VLDVGCGTGDLTLAALAYAGPQGEVVGIDASPEMIEVARRKATRRGALVRFELAAVERIPFPDNYFDVALSSLMLHHLPGRLKQDGLAEVYRVLKPGGRLLVVDMQDRPSRAGRVLTAVLGHGARHRSPGNLQTLLGDAGFAVGAEGSLAAGVLAYAMGTKGGIDPQRDTVSRQ
jgi:demethylmenaquinone methyltransferase/2-methoxy-6-polyprenyl-1,4-benzoquinol methylase/phosphoethanolamine N-methyltransferase